MCTASSAKRTTAASASAVEDTATDLTPSSLQARATRRAISPRLAIRIFWNTMTSIRPAGAGSLRATAWLSRGVAGLQVHEHLLKLHPLAIFHSDLDDAPGALCQ